MNVCVVTHSCPAAFLLAGLLAVAPERLIGHVCLVGKGMVFDKCEFVTQKGKFEVQGAGRLKLVELGSESARARKAINSCHVVVVCTYKHEQKLIGSWFHENCPDTTAMVLLMSVGTGADFFDFLEQVDLDKLEPYLLKGCFGPTARVEMLQGGLRCTQSSLGHCAMERLSKEKKHFVNHVLLLEKASSLCFVSHNLKQVNNWTYADTIWKSMQVVSGAFFKEEKLSLYEQLRARPRFRRLCASWLQEALDTLEGEKLSLLNTATSPFGLSVPKAVLLLRLQQPYFSIGLTIVMRFASLNGADRLDGCCYSEASETERKELLVSLLRHGDGAKKHKLIAATAAAISQTKDGTDAMHLESLLRSGEVQLLPLVSNANTVAIISLFFLGIALLARYLVHAYEVLLYT